MKTNPRSIVGPPTFALLQASSPGHEKECSKAALIVFFNQQMLLGNC